MEDEFYFWEQIEFVVQGDISAWPQDFRLLSLIPAGGDIIVEQT